MTMSRPNSAIRSSRGQSSTEREPSTIRFRTSLHNTIFDCLQKRGWTETDSDTDWDFSWADVGWMRDNYDRLHMDDHQRLNHFRNHYELTRKDLLVKNLKRSKKALERESRFVEAAKYEFFPPTYVVPTDYGLFLEEFKRTPGAVWIMKPIGKAQGRGIFLFNKMSQISEWKRDHRWKSENPQAESYIAQRYIPNPYLIGGKKFDLRIYVLVLSYSPLVVYFHRSGFARFSGTRFTMKSDEIQNNYIHLTNVAIQKTAENYDSAACKWDCRRLRMHMNSVHGVDAVNELFYDIQMVVIRSLLSTQKIMINDKHCFELYGYDILVDADLKPWLIEVNASPSLSADSKADYTLKSDMLTDMLDVLDLEQRYPITATSPRRQQVGGFDLIWDNGPVRSEKTKGYQSLLGACLD